MDDAVNQRKAPTPIPILTPALHCAAMTALVYLRGSFGYTFLRPKGIFIAVSWAFALFAIFAWNEPQVWREYRAACIFGAGAVALYFFNLLLTFRREWGETADADLYPGKSYLNLFARAFGITAIPDKNLHLWIEPGVVLITACALRLVLGEHHLSTWLYIVALSMAGREAINHWIAVRRRKGTREGIDKAKEQGEIFGEDTPVAPAPKAVRKEQVKRKRNTAPVPEPAPESRFEKVLRLRQPFTLADAEEQYRMLIRLEHPDTNHNSPESNAVTAELNEAIDYFRKRLEG